MEKEVPGAVSKYKEIRARKWESVSKDLSEWGVPVKDCQRYISDFGKDKLIEMCECFKIFDHTDTGHITKPEMVLVSNCLGKGWNRHFIKRLLEDGDKNGDTVLDFMEFVELYLAYESEFQDVLNDLKVAFEVMDTDQSGYLSPDELKIVMDKIGRPMSDEETAHFLEIADKNGDGEIDFVEFAKLVIK
ncbi:neo-calmodulin-like [Convolutriloba macropyga]|uniref:neo-calmodulin-like n=1 Tax=Convolutriloba macropyga TaxID=536237 RepID=UPI003F51EF58